MKLLMFAGAGQVGKTVLLDECVRIALERHLQVETHKSNTRQSYAEVGLKREDDALKDPAFNIEFQNKVMANNCEELLNKVRAAEESEIDLFITDRTPYDYAGYFFQVFQNQLTLNLIEQKRAAADGILHCLLNICSEIQIWNLPYPTPWARDTQSSDGWRADKTGKNFIWSAVVESELADAKRRLHAHNFRGSGRLMIDRLPSFAERGSVEMRAASVMTSAFSHMR